MGEQRNNSAKDSAEDREESSIKASRRAKRYIFNKDILAKLKRKREEQHRRARRFAITINLLEANGRPGQGARIIDLSMNEARVELPFAPPFMSQMALTFALGGADKVFKVVGRVIWSRMLLEKGWYEVGIQFYQNYWEIDHLLRLDQR
jgi:hypothetical protein